MRVVRSSALGINAAVLAALVTAWVVPQDRGVVPSNDAPSLRIELNIPAFRLDVWSDTVLVRSYAVAVGAPRYPTPRGSFTLTRVIWNPWWVPPPSEWARAEKVTPPGPDNPMGKVKLLLGSFYYLHGTPVESSIGSAASHGCVRMRNADAIDLARLVIEATGAALSAESIDSLIGSSRETRDVTIPVEIPAALVYRVAELRGDTLLIHRDVYGLVRSRIREEALRALGGRVPDPSAVDTAVLAQAIHASRSSRSAPVRVPLDSLLWDTP